MIERLASAERGVGDAESVTCAVKPKVVAAVGVPEITPPVDKLRPGGSEPTVIAQE
jgi:hypothetical protein